MTLFGTDGVRGVAGEYPLDPRTIARLGAAIVRALPAASILQAGAALPRLIVGRDTRESGVWIEQALARGVNAERATLTTVGVVPTPAVAYLTRALGFDAGMVISASHNPFRDNGIKVFSGRGEKYTDRFEREIEETVAEASWAVPADAPASVEARDYRAQYLAHVGHALPDASRLGELRIVIDCANGATTTVAPTLFRGFGFDTAVIHAEPDGRNINLACGSTHPERLTRAVRDTGARLGVAFDGDGDRAIFVDHTGEIVNGDAVMLLCAKHMKARDELRGNAIVATVMSNVGLEMALREVDVDLVRCPVGDKYVMEEMMKRGLSLGGEQSGHVIFSEHLYTGDGIVTALRVLRVMADTGRELADLAADLITFPQVLVNVRVKEKRDLAGVPAVADAMSRVERQLGGGGRLLVRYSGTEPLLRIMIEGRDQRAIHAWANEIAETVKVHLG